MLLDHGHKGCKSCVTSLQQRRKRRYSSVFSILFYGMVFARICISHFGYFRCIPSHRQIYLFVKSRLQAFPTYKMAVRFYLPKAGYQRSYFTLWYLQIRPFCRCRPWIFSLCTLAGLDPSVFRHRQSALQSHILAQTTSTPVTPLKKKISCKAKQGTVLLEQSLVIS